MSVQVGYFWKKPETGSGKDGFSYKGELANIDPRTTYQTQPSGRLHGRFLHFRKPRIQPIPPGDRLRDAHAGPEAFPSAVSEVLERAEFDAPEHKDTIWGVGGRASYMPLKWLTLALEVSHREGKSDVDAYEYTENRGMFTITATY